MTGPFGRTLIVGPSWVGDMVMAQALFRRIKRLDPDATLDVVGPPWSLPLTDRMPEVSRSLALDVRHGQFGLGTRRQLGHSLRDRHYDTAFILPRSWKSALVPWFAGARRRIGHLGEFRHGLINAKRAQPIKPDDAPKPRTVDSFVALADPLEPTLRDDEFPILIAQQDRISVLRSLDLWSSDARVVALCPGAEYGPAKQWPLPHFKALAESLTQQGHAVWIIGSDKDRAAGDTIIHDLPRDQVVNFAGQTKLGQAIDLLAASDAVVSNDSGLMHVAAALQRPTVALFGSSSELVTPPLSPTAHVLSRELPCRPCFKRECPLGHLDCLNTITLGEVRSMLGPALGR